MNPFDEKVSSRPDITERDPYLSTLPHGTVGAVAVDADGMVACATSTGGKTNKNGEYSIPKVVRAVNIYIGCSD